jgi:cell filamentation protein, protein adenylyltransferase
LINGDHKNMANERVSGTYITNSHSSESFKSYVPKPLPPDPPLNLSGEHYALLDKATLALGRLDGLTIGQLPADVVSLYTYFYVRKEAVVSSQIEGTQSSLSDLILYENNEVPAVPVEDVGEVLQYVRAMKYGLKRLREDNFPLSLRLIREIHEILLSSGRGSEMMPGEFRTSQNWIGGTRPGNARFVPPPPNEVVACMGALEKFIHEKNLHMQVLVKAALVHVQFETIHPFLDGNGRVGRLLITLFLCAEGILQEPMLYLSLYFKQHREIYYDLLERVRTDGNWESWLHFFLTGLYETATQAARTSKNILELFQNDQRSVETSGRSLGTTFRVFKLLQSTPLITIARASQETQISVPTVTAALTRLQELGIVREITNKRRDKLFSYENYLRLLNEGTEPLRR